MFKNLVKKYGAMKPEYYLFVYEQLFRPFQNEAISILEIGVQSGASLRVWADYFPNAHISGIDLRIPFGSFGERINIFQGDQADRHFLQDVINDAGPFDIIIDDGSHKPFDWCISFNKLFSALNPGGYYVIEDLMAPTHQGWDSKEKEHIAPCLIDIFRPLLVQVEGSGGFEWITLRPHLFIAKKYKAE